MHNSETPKSESSDRLCRVGKPAPPFRSGNQGWLQAVGIGENAVHKGPLGNIADKTRHGDASLWTEALRSCLDAGGDCSVSGDRAGHPRTDDGVEKRVVCGSAVTESFETGSPHVSGLPGDSNRILFGASCKTVSDKRSHTPRRWKNRLWAGSVSDHYVRNFGEINLRSSARALMRQALWRGHSCLKRRDSSRRSRKSSVVRRKFRLV